MTILGLSLKAKQATPPILGEFKSFMDKHILRKEIGCKRFNKSFMIGIGAQLMPDGRGTPQGFYMNIIDIRGH